MFASRLFILTTLVACTVVPATQCRAQAYGLEGIVEDNDLRWFEPAELDLDGRLEKETGYFLKIKKEGLFITGERVEIGDPDTVVLSEQVYGDTTLEEAQQNVDLFFINNPTTAADLGLLATTLGVGFQEVGGVVVTVPVTVSVTDDAGVTTDTIVNVPQVDQILESAPDAFIVRNSILDATPKAELGWGEEYEFGHSDGKRGWLMRVLDGPEVNSGGTFGAGEGSPYTSQSSDPNGLANTDPFYGGSPVDADGDGRLDTVGDLNDIYALGFGSVAVNFAAPEDYFVGLRDYVLNGDPTAGTQTGPIFYIGNYGAINDDDDFDLDVPAISDDLDGDGDTFFLILGDINGDGDVDDDEVVGTFIDFGDLYEFNVFFDQVDVRNRVELDGVELMFTHELDRGHKLDRGRRDDLQLRYGVSFLRFRDDFNFEGLGSILGRTTVNHEVDNQIVGPSVGIRWRRDHGKWDFSLDSQVSLAYNIVDHRQNGIFGEELIPGALNRPILGRTFTGVDSQHDDDFSPMAEIRAEARYKITKALAVTVGYKAKFIDNIQRSSEAIVWSNEWGINPTKSDVFINGITMGVEFRH